MSFPKYPEYRESGVEWLGEVPKHWACTSLKKGYVVTLGKMLQPERKANSDVLKPYIRAANIQWVGIDVSDVKEMWFSPAEIESLSLEPGDLLVSEGGDVGRSALWRRDIVDCYFQNSVNRIRPFGGNSTEYLYYWMSALKDKGFIDVVCNKSTIAHFTAEKVQAVPVLFPSPQEQSAIAAFLNRETAKIDALVAEQEKLIELLKETIVTLALSAFTDPTSQETRLGNIVDVISRPVTQAAGEHYEPLGIYNRGRGLFHKDPREMEEMGDSIFFWVKEGDLIISGQFAWEGAVALAQATEEGCVVSHRYPVLRGRKSVALTEYIYALLLTKHGDFLLNENSRGAAGRNRPLNINLLLKEKVLVPNLNVQRKISEVVHSEISISKEVQKAIILLKERRAALISAAVTGKIDVRGLADAMQ